MDLLEKAWWNKTWTSILVRLGIRRVPGATSGLGDILYGLSITGGETTADMTLYVDQATGSDSNTGLVGFPLKTIQAAIDRVPKIVKHNVTINVAAGAYTDDVNIYFEILGSKTVLIQGTNWTTFTPATGPATGTFTANDSVHTFTLAGATWTVDDLKGKFLKITSGAKSGIRYPIANNTATTIDVGCLASQIGNASFVFESPAASMTKSFYVTGNNSTATGQIKISGFAFSVASTAITSSLGGWFYVDSCSFSNGGLSTTKVRNVYFYNSYVYAGVLSLRETTSSRIADCVMEGGTRESAITLWGEMSFGVSSNSGVIIQNYTNNATLSAGIVMEGSTLANLGYMTIRNCKNGIRTYSGGFARANAISGAAASSLLNISGCVNGINVFKTCPLNISGDSLLPLSITSGTNGIKISGTGSRILLRSTTTITGNSGFGILVDAGVDVSMNTVTLGTSVTMNTNTAGDLTLDGTTPISIADLRAAPSKTIVDGNRLNRLAAD